MAENDSSVKIPTFLWKVMEPKLREKLSEYDSDRRRRVLEFGSAIFLRLRNSEEKLVHVNWQGEIYAEEFRGQGYRSDVSGSPSFTSEEIESWGYREKVRQPTLWNPFRKIYRWQVLAWADEK